MDSSDSDMDSDVEILADLNQFYRRVNRPYVVRERTDHFEKWDEVEFMRRFRISKPTFMIVLGEIEVEITHRTNRNHALTAADQLLLCLRFYATGCLQITAGDFTGVHQTTAGRVVKRVTNALASKRRHFINVPMNNEEQQQIQQGFYNIARFPLVGGALDCTHIRIQSPGGETAEIFRNRKAFFSLNCQVLGSYNLKILDLVARWPGASHDSMIFRNSRLCHLYESGQMGQQLILGDAGYPITGYLMTPLADPVTDAEKLYNESHIRTRNTVERLFGVWKRRFPVLALGMRVEIELVQAIVVATAILHNICVDNNDYMPEVDQDLEIIIAQMGNVPMEEYNNPNNLNVRRLMLINDYFNNLE